MSLCGLSADELLQIMNDGRASCHDVVGAHLDRIESVDNQVGAFLRVNRQQALHQAKRIDERRTRGDSLGKLAGLPVAVKDNLCTRGEPTTCASRMLERFVPPYGAHVIERLQAEDAIVIGRTNLDEFAMGSSCENSALRQTHNPWDLDHAPGGSSGGSAAAVAAGMATLAVGSDTGGSIRQPASFCGVVGLKPTYGRVSRYGLVAFASSLDQIGPLTGDVRGAARLLEVLAGYDERDSTSVHRPVPNYLTTLEERLNGLRVGVVSEHFGDGLGSEVRSAVESAIDVYRRLGSEVKEISLPHSAYCVAVYYIVASSEASSNLARYDGVHYGFRADNFEDMVDMYETTRGQGFGDEVKRRIMLGTYALSSGYYDAYYLKALKVRRLIRRDFDAAFEQVDVIAAPVAPRPAFRLGELLDDPLQMYLQDIYTLSANLAGIPGISLPCGKSSDGLPIGLQLMAAPFEEERLLRAARMYECETEWHTMKPTLS